MLEAMQAQQAQQFAQHKELIAQMISINASGPQRRGNPSAEGDAGLEEWGHTDSEVYQLPSVQWQA